MAKVKKVSINAFENVLKEKYPNNYVVQWEGLDIVITNTVSLQDVAEIVAEVTANAFLSDGTYVPEMMDAVLQRAIVSRYTNLNLPSNISTCYEMIERSEIMNFVLEHINYAQYNEICQAVRDKVEYMCDSRSAEIEASMQKMLGAFDNLQEKTSDMFENVSPEDLQKLIGAMGENGELTAEKVVREYIDQTRVKDPGDK